MDILDSYEELGDAVDAAWAKANFHERAFPEIAEAALAARTLPAQFSLTALVREVLAAPARRLLPQDDIASAFGEPPLTVYAGRRFYLAINVWSNASTSIHEHGFTGAFQVMSGSSFHGRYTFREAREVNTRLRIGEVSLTDIEFLQPGDIRPILPAGTGAHSLFHIERPSTTLVVRTRGEPGFTQHTYLPPAISYDSFYLGAPVEVVALRRRELLNLLAATSFEDFLPMFLAYLRGCEVSTAFEAILTLLRPLMDRAGDLANLEPLLGEIVGAVEQRDAEFAAALHASLWELVRTQNVLHRREAIHDPDGRYLMAVLLNAPDRATALGWLRQRWPDRDPVATVLDLIDGLAVRADPGDPALNVLGLERDAVTVLREMVRAPGTVHDLAGRLAAALGHDAVEASRNELLALDNELRTMSAFRPLFRTR